MIAVLITICWLGAIGAVLCLFAGSGETTCNQNCDQGRNCTCRARGDA